MAGACFVFSQRQALQGLGYLFKFHRAAGLDQDCIARVERFGQGGNERVAAFEVDAAHVARGLARGEQEGGRGERLFAELAVHPRAVGAEVEHVAEDADQPPGQVGGGVDRQRGGVRVGVIAVVDYREAGRAQHARAVPDRGVFGEAGGYLRVAEAELHAHGGRGEGGVDKVAAEGGDFGAYPPPAPDNPRRGGHYFLFRPNLSQSVRAGVCGFCQSAFEKHTLSRNDLNALYYLYNFVGLPAELICAIIEYCAAKGKRSMQYLVKTAIGLYEENDIDTYEKFEQYTERRRTVDDGVSKLRKLLGIGDRALTTNESQFTEIWFAQREYPFELVRYAYELTVDKLGKYNMKYMNAPEANYIDFGGSTISELDGSEGYLLNGEPYAGLVEGWKQRDMNSFCTQSE